MHGLFDQSVKQYALSAQSVFSVGSIRFANGYRDGEESGPRRGRRLFGIGSRKQRTSCQLVRMVGMGFGGCMLAGLRAVSTAFIPDVLDMRLLVFEIKVDISAWPDAGRGGEWRSDVRISRTKLGPDQEYFSLPGSCV